MVLAFFYRLLRGFTPCNWVCIFTMYLGTYVWMSILIFENNMRDKEHTNEHVITHPCPYSALARKRLKGSRKGGEMTCFG